MRVSVDEGTFVDRTAERASVAAALLKRSGVPQALVWAGDAGVGKSRLLAVVAAEAASHGAVVLQGSCLNVGDSWPYHPLWEGLRRLETDPPDASTGASARDLLELLGGTTGGDSTSLTLARLHGGLVHLAAGRPLIVVLDDLRWVDSSTRRLVVTLLSGLTTTDVLILGAVRTDDLTGDSPVQRLVQELRRSRSAEVHELEPLNRVFTTELAEAVAGRTLSPATTEQLWQRSGGNPFVIESLARGGENVAPVAGDLRGVLLSGFEAAPRSVQDLVSTVSVALEPVPHEILVRVLGRPDRDVVDDVKLAIAARLLSSTSAGYTLRHQILQESLTADLLPAEKRALHRRYAEALTEPGAAGRREQLAYHWRETGDPVRALPAVVAAAHDAERLHAFGEAWQHWQVALELLASGPMPAQAEPILLGAAEAAHLAGDHVGALAVLDRLLQLPGAMGQKYSANKRATYGARRARFLAAQGQLSSAVEEYDHLLGLPGLENGERASMAANSAELIIQLGRYSAAADRARLALTFCSERQDDVGASVLATTVLGSSQAYLGDPIGGRAAAERALLAAESSGRAELIATTYLHLVYLLSGILNQLEDGVAVAHRGAQRVAEIGGPRAQTTQLLAAAANGLFRLGRWAEAAEVTSQALSEDPTGAAAVSLLLSRARIVMGLGELDAAESDLRSAGTLLAGETSSRELVPLATLQAGLALWRRDASEARAAVRRGLDVGGPDFGDWWLLAPLIWHGIRAEAEAAADGWAVEHTSVQQLTAAFDRITVQSAYATITERRVVEGYDLLCKAELTRVAGTSDFAAWRAAADFWDRHSQPYPASYARFHQAEALFSARTGNHEAAAVLNAAHVIAVRLSAGPLCAEIESLARRARVNLGREDPVPAKAIPVKTNRPGNVLGALTVREREVVAEIASGHSNRDIAAHLFISEKTVEVHVSRILTKLGARTRVQAAGLYLRSTGESRSHGRRSD